MWYADFVAAEMRRQRMTAYKIALSGKANANTMHNLTRASDGRTRVATLEKALGVLGYELAIVRKSDGMVVSRGEGAI